MRSFSSATVTQLESNSVNTCLANASPLRRSFIVLIFIKKTFKLLFDHLLGPAVCATNRKRQR